MTPKEEREAVITELLHRAELIRGSVDIYTGNDRLLNYRRVVAANRFLKSINRIDPAAFNQARCDPPLTDDERAEHEKRAQHDADVIGGKRRISAAHATGEHEKVERALSAIAEVYNEPDPRVFVRAGKLSRIIYNEDRVPSIQQLDQGALSAVMAQCIEWYGTREVLDKTTIPPTPIKEDFVTTCPRLVTDRLAGLGEWPGLPPLVGIAENPYLNDDGAVISTPGYNPEKRLYLSENCAAVTVPEVPTPEQVKAAKDLLFDLISEFKFESEADRENYIATLITVVLKPNIKGITPLYVVDKPVMGAGASLLGEILATISTGRPAAMTQAPEKKSDGEMNKLIIGLLREGRTLTIFDNVEGDIYSPALAALLTSEVYKGRILGKNQTEEYRNNMVLVVNGNNVQITNDLARRCVWSRLVTDTARPYEKTDWKIPNIRQHVTDNQGLYLSAVLTIGRAWYLAGKPGCKPGLQVMGGFEAWRDMLGGIMNFIGCDHFLENTALHLEICEEQHDDKAEFLKGLYDHFGRGYGKDDGWINSKEFTVKEIKELLDKFGEHPLMKVLPDELLEILNHTPEKFSQATGHLFRGILGRVYPSGYKIERVSVTTKRATYRIFFKDPVPAKKEESDKPGQGTGTVGVLHEKSC